MLESHSMALKTRNLA